ncbi:MAG TPA: Uma2 family endonuclease [Iamia sp.]|nr:Uma2 family endonuclease [Iamia sp.]
MSLAARDRLTFEEFLAIADELPPGSQLIDGEVVVCVPVFRHQLIAAAIFESFVLFSQGDRSLGQMGWAGLVQAGEHDAYVPDIWWVATADALPYDTGVFPEVPSLVIEVRSPSTWHLDRGRKLRRYEAKGVPEVWLVDGIDDEVTVHRRSEGSAGFDQVTVLHPGDTLATPVVPGWVVDLGELLRR